MSFSPPEVPQVDLGPTFEDSGYDTSNSHADDDVAFEGVGQWAAEQLSTLHTEAQLPSAADIFYEQDGSTDSDKHEYFLSRLGRRKWPLGVCT
jgi:hypothetical protein